MADSKLRLQIITALDNAGLKATQQQLDSLEKQLTNVSSKGGSGFDGLSGKLQKMPGLVGDITGSFGKVGASIGYAYVAYQTFEKGVKAGNAIFEQFGDGAGYSLESIGNGFSTLGDKIKNGLSKFLTGTSEEDAIKQANEIAEKNTEIAIQSAEKANKKKIELMKKEQDEHKKVIDKIQQETTAYIRQVESLGNLKSSLGNAKALMLERTKIQEQRNYDLMGRSDIADQIGLAYDVEIQRVKNQSLVDANSLEERKADKEARTALELAQKQRQKTDDIHKRMTAVQNEIDERKKQAGKGENLAMLKELKSQYKSLDEDYKKALDAEKPLVDDARMKMVKVQNIKQLGANLRLSNQTALEQAMINYDNFQLENGNVGNFSFDEKWVESLNQMAKEWKYMEETAKNTESLAEKLEEILKAKE